jgi:hypothetical protein
VSDLHLYEFGAGGFYVAENKDEAIRLSGEDIGDQSEAESDFVREVPDDELVEVCSEDETDRWDDPREEFRFLTRKGVPAPEHGRRWMLKIPAREWANQMQRGKGYAFGGDQ